MSRQSHSLSSDSGKSKSAQLALTLMLGLFVLLVVPLHPYYPAIFLLTLGLATQLLGDFLLVIRGYGRIRFITYSVASLFYSSAYWIQTNGISNWWLPILLFASGIVMLLLILPQVESRVFPTSVIGVLLLGLLWATGEWWIQQHSANAFLALLGAGGLLTTSLFIAFRKDGCVFYSDCRSCLIGYIVSQALLVVSLLI